ncbi:hypothetical protein HO133_001451 [Letharia lupina]|uniref:Uncharacterized protein n=1 Tax=Letharia lupina TaxID=560253 RepID=A0A8H6FBK2_9LECA|nr:uncharacterized protein HO133_001451 [Letharia lupina]KAF6222365.1 hypothetical protein HO133_001451 [Letharia lupina]
MCEYTRNYYVYSNCTDPAMHFTRTSTEGNAKKKCAKAPHERFIVVSGSQSPPFRKEGAGDVEA